MKKIIRTSLSLFILLVLSACNLFAPSNNAITGETPVLRLAVQTANGVNTFSGVGQVINYNYVVTNTGSSPLAGPVFITDPPRAPICPDLSTVGNGDAFLNLNETATCTASYTITQTDVTNGSVIDVATANAGGTTSNQSGVTLTLGVATGITQTSTVLTLTKTASSQTYGAVDQSIDYNYTITNAGTAPLGPTQFVVTDNKFPGPLNCGPPNTTLAPSQSVTCTFTYKITQADMGAVNVINSATASGAGQTSAPATTTITNLAAPAAPTPSTIQTATLAPASNLAPGSTIQHQVAVGEWLIQIGRCYGATFEDVRNANPQIADPNFILPSMIIAVPRIGSAGRIYGPPCITFYTVQSGDTWASIAQRYNADIAVLQHVNQQLALTAGTVIKIPLNSAGAVGVSVTAAPGTATATPTATATTAVTAQRITIPAGQTTLSLAGVVNANQTVQYVLSAAQGQVLNVSLTGPTNTEVTLGVTGPTGLALKQADGTFTWSTTIITGGDHYISITGLNGISTKTYTLTVSLTSPGTATVTSTPSTPSP
jgi:LysM repeat protein